jgi:hypothetical protein
MPGHRTIGRLATLDNSSVMCPVNPGSTKPAVECVSCHLGLDVPVEEEHEPEVSVTR